MVLVSNSPNLPLGCEFSESERKREGERVVRTERRGEEGGKWPAQSGGLREELRMETET